LLARAAATLLRPVGGRQLIPEDAFGVHLKASSVRVISYKDKPGVGCLTANRQPVEMGRDFHQAPVENPS
jgi:hypothetical protein